MKKLWIFILSAIILTACNSGDEPIHVACIGDSITYGANIKDREAMSYPTQLSEMLGEGYIVKNFGRSGATLLYNGNRPYIQTNEFKAIKDFRPNIAYIMLGTNDSKPGNSELLDGEYLENYNSLIDSITMISPECKIIVMTPLAAHNYEWRMGGIDDEVIEKKIIPMVREIAYERDLEILDMHPMFIDYSYEMMPDSIHPSAIGATRIAKRVYEQLNMECEDFKFEHEDGQIGRAHV